MRLHFLLKSFVLVLPCWFDRSMNTLVACSTQLRIRILKKTSGKNKGTGDWEKNLHSENKKLTKGRTQQSDSKEREMGKNLRKIVFARGVMDITKCRLCHEQENDISVHENAKLDYPSPNF